jgi:hypothetical protein
LVIASTTSFELLFVHFAIGFDVHADLVGIDEDDSPASDGKNFFDRLLLEIQFGQQKAILSMDRPHSLERLD